MKVKIKFVLLIFAIPLILPLLKTGFPITDDAGWFLIRFTAFHQELAAGQIPVRWLNRLNHGYGYPVPTFNYPGYMYLAEIPKILGFSFINSFKAVLLMSILSAVLFTYLWLKENFNRWSALVGSLFYIYSPYYLFDTYKRGTIGEILALAVVSFTFYTIKKRRWVLSALGYGLLILSHNILALIFLPVLFAYQSFEYFFSPSGGEISNIKHASTAVRRRGEYPISSFLLGLGLSAFFWLPALYELRFTTFNQVQVSDSSEYFLSMEKLLLLGIVNLSIFISVIIYWFFHRRQLSLDVPFFIIVGGLGGFLTLPISQPLWKILPLDRFIQFPFRLLSLWIVAIAYLTAFIISIIAKKTTHVHVFFSNLVIGIILLGILLQAMPWLKDIKYVYHDDLYYATNESTSTIHDEYMPVWVKEKPTNRPERVPELIVGSGRITGVKNHLNRLELNINATEKTVLQVNKIYWPGWKAKIDDNEEVEIDYSNNKGVMQIVVPAGKHKVEFSFTETPLRLFANLVSGVSLILTVGLLLRNYKHGKG